MGFSQPMVSILKMTKRSRDGQMRATFRHQLATSLARIRVVSFISVRDGIRMTAVKMELDEKWNGDLREEKSSERTSGVFR